MLSQWPNSRVANITWIMEYVSCPIRKWLDTEMSIQQYPRDKFISVSQKYLDSTAKSGLLRAWNYSLLEIFTHTIIRYWALRISGFLQPMTSKASIFAEPNIYQCQWWSFELRSYTGKQWCNIPQILITALIIPSTLCDSIEYQYYNQLMILLRSLFEWFANLAIPLDKFQKNKQQFLNLMRNIKDSTCKEL